MLPLGRPSAVRNDNGVTRVCVFMLYTAIRTTLSVPICCFYQFEERRRKNIIHESHLQGGALKQELLSLSAYTTTVAAGYV